MTIYSFSLGRLKLRVMLFFMGHVIKINVSNLTIVGKDFV